MSDDPFIKAAREAKSGASDASESPKRSRRSRDSGTPAGAGQIVIDRGDPYANAKDFVARNFTAQEWYTLRHHRGGFYNWNGTAYPEVTDQSLRAQLWEWLSR